MVDEVVDLLGPVPAGPVVDATVGGGGHAGALLGAHPHLRVIGLDRDVDALAAAGANLARFGDRVELHHVRFDRLADVLADAGVPVITAALFARFASRQEESFAAKVNAALRNQFGGHAIRAVEEAKTSPDPR